MTNEQAVLEAGKDISRLKKIYTDHLTPIALEYQQKKIDPTLQALLATQQMANEYFNYVERFVGDSGLLGAHNNGKWVTGFAEDCREILESYIQHMKFIRHWKTVLGNSAEPSSNAYSNMQRMVVEYLSEDQSKIIEQQFINNSLPIQGFKMKAVPDKTSKAIEQNTYNISGPNARVNNNSIDNSTNTVTMDPSLSEHIEALRGEITRLINSSEQKEALEIVDAVESQFMSEKPSKLIVSTLLSALPDVASIATIGSFLLSSLAI